MLTVQPQQTKKMGEEFQEISSNQSFDRSLQREPVSHKNLKASEHFRHCAGCSYLLTAVLLTDNKKQNTESKPFHSFPFSWLHDLIIFVVFCLRSIYTHWTCWSLSKKTRFIRHFIHLLLILGATDVYRTGRMFQVRPPSSPGRSVWPTDDSLLTSSSSGEGRRGHRMWRPQRPCAPAAAWPTTAATPTAEQRTLLFTVCYESIRGSIMTWQASALRIPSAGFQSR